MLLWHPTPSDFRLEVLIRDLRIGYCYVFGCLLEIFLLLSLNKGFGSYLVGRCFVLELYKDEEVEGTVESPYAVKKACYKYNMWKRRVVQVGLIVSDLWV